MLNPASRGEEADTDTWPCDLRNASVLPMPDATAIVPKMIGLLSLSTDLIELVCEQVLTSPEAGLKAWCRLSSTCKHLWDMQLPHSTSDWLLDMNDSIEGGSKTKNARLALHTLMHVCSPTCCSCANISR